MEDTNKNATKHKIAASPTSLVIKERKPWRFKRVKKRKANPHPCDDGRSLERRLFKRMVLRIDTWFDVMYPSLKLEA